MRTLSLLLAASVLVPATGLSQVDEETLRTAKTLFFDRQYADAREAWREVHEGGGRQATAALYWVARCSEKLGENERALAEYERFLGARPSDTSLREEARLSRVALATRLYKAGRTRHLDLLHGSLDDPNQTVRYFAALQLASLGPEVGREAVPVLQEILKKEEDEDLVERAKLALLRVDRSALAEATPAPARRDGQTAWIRVRIWEKGASKPQLSLNLPVFLAEMVFNSLPDEARDELREEGFDARSFWERVKRSGPTDILTVEDEDGTRIQVWVE
jgi:tetratricopeptide (TPR) repeat protein